MYSPKCYNACAATENMSNKTSAVDRGVGFAGRAQALGPELVTGAETYPCYEHHGT